MPRCFSCNNEIAREFVEALGHQWHPEHFACVVCHHPFGKGQFIEHDNQPYGEKDYCEKFGKRCHGCGEPIRGQYLDALGYPWHPEHFCCTICRKPLDHGQFFENDGHPYCEDDYCEKFSARCKGCGKAIHGDYIQALGSTWHREHLVCAICQRPFGDKGFLEHDGKPYCEHDYYDRFGLHCAVCGEPMHGTFLVGSWGESFCKSHQSELKPCFSCNRLICQKLTGGGVEYQDGRQICNTCRETAIDDQNRAQQLFDEVRNIMMVSFGIHIDHPEQIPLHLAGLDEIDRLAGGTPAIEAGITLTVVTTCGNEEVSRIVKEVVILYGLPKDHTMSIMAHEFGHVWCFLQGFPDLEKKTKEGLCQLFAYLCLTKRDTAAAKFRMKEIAENLDPVYGDGFREAYQAMSDGSLAQLLERVRSRRAL